MNEQAEYQERYEEIVALSKLDETEAEYVVNEANRIASEASELDLPQPIQTALFFTASSIALNFACESDDPELIKRGQELAERALRATNPAEPLHFQCRYNIANAQTALAELSLPKKAVGLSREEWEPLVIKSRLESSNVLMKVRNEYFEIGNSDNADDHTRSSAFCNLANALDHSGRWAEAYDFYLRALDIDPDNGNAAGNLAFLLQNRVESGIGQTGHIAAVYDKYAELAKSLYEGTLTFTSQKVAERWDRLLPSESLGHLSHGLDDTEVSDFEYRQWVASLRLALSSAVEGLGADDLRWDSATIERLYGASPEAMNPPILGEMNVLKSDFLVSRRLAYDSLATIPDDLSQTPNDSGAYTETLDGSLYGLQYSMLLLAQRSALDVLDKTAVVANEYFDAGDKPNKVSFRQFWKGKSGSLRDALIKGPGRSLPNLALYELALDMNKGGIYEMSQALRNAGTHRIVHAAWLEPEGVTDSSRSRIHLRDLIDSTILALQVTRSAYLYLIDLVAMWNHPDDHQGEYHDYPDFRYMNDPEADDPLHLLEHSLQEADDADADLAQSDGRDTD